MAGSFRFEPPSPASGLLTRPRLLRALLARWDVRVVTVVGGAGLGKTTLLAQAVAENQLAPRGEDVWVGLQPGDADAESLARTVATAVGDTATVPDAGSMAEALWRRAPNEVCLVVDDTHLLAPGSAGAAWLGELVAALPANGHLVLAGRSEPPVPLARLRAQRVVAGVAEDELRFTTAELDELAARHGVDADRFSDLGGWPAMAVLAATVERRHAGGFLWEEVLEPLGEARRRVLAVVSDLGGADDDLAGAALAEPVGLADALAGVPLVAVGDDGTHVPHPLWQTSSGLALDPGTRATARRRAVTHLVDRGRFDEAFRLAAAADLWDVVPAVLQAACTTSGRPTAPTLQRWTDACPADVLDSAGGRLAAALLASYVDPATAETPLRSAAERCRSDGDVDGELAALAERGRVAWWRQDLDTAATVALRVDELAAAGHPQARGLAGVSRVVFADLAGDDAGALATLDAIEAGTLDRGWEASMRWFRARIVCSLGDADEALAIIDGTDATGDRVLASVLAMLRLAARWALGRVDEVLDAMSHVSEAVTDAGVTHNRRLGEESGAILLAHVGRVDEARRLLERVDTTLPAEPRRGSRAPDASARSEPPSAHDRADPPSGRRAIADATIALAEGNEAAATATLRAAIAVHTLDKGPMRREWRSFIALTYVLVPETREHWDAAPLRGVAATTRTLASGVVSARAVVAAGGRPARSGGALDHLRAIDVPNPQVVRGCLHIRFAAVLAVGLDGRPPGG